MKPSTRVWVYIGGYGDPIMVSVLGFRLADGHINEEQANELAKALGDPQYGVYDIRTNSAEFKEVL